MARLVHQPSAAFLVSLAVLLALLHAVLGLTATVGTSVTFDETAHLTAGYSYNRYADFRLHPENGNLPQRWAALPMALIRPAFPELEASAGWKHRNVWVVGREFLYELGNDTDFMIFCGRAMITLFSAATGLLIFAVSRRLFGLRGAFLSLLLYAFCPSFLGHGALATSDAAAAFLLLAAVITWWWHLQQPGWRRALVSGIVFGLACVTKFSAALLLPMFVLLALLRLAQPASSNPTARPRPTVIIAAAIAQLVIAWVVIWAFFAFRYSPFNAGPTIAPTLPVSVESSPLFTLLAHARRLHLLPEAFIHGFEFTLTHATLRDAFLNGERSQTGWIVFFPFAFAVKTTLPLLLLSIAGAAVWMRRLAANPAGWRTELSHHLWRIAPLLVLFGVYWLFALTSNLNIGHRHILPTYLVLFILVGAFGPVLEWKRPALLILVGGLAAWHIVESFTIRPHYLAYFNQLIGGPRNGHRHLVDSSLDWGQDLPRLARWLTEHNSKPQRDPVYLAYFGTGEPIYEGISAAPLLWRQYPPANPWRSLEAGVYCVSATLLQQVSSSLPDGWAEWQERNYQAFRAQEQRWLAVDPHHRRTRSRDARPRDRWEELAASRFSELQFARLCHYLRARPPDEMIGYSILVYRLSDSEVQAAVRGSLADLANAIEQATATSP